MIYIEAPKLIDYPKDAISVFLAGTITGSWDWQRSLVEKLRDLDIVIFNPRREKFDVDDRHAAKSQIIWEFNMLRKATFISFWFSDETLSPIALYELGAHSMTDKPLVIGVDPAYERKVDVQIQMDLVRPGMPVFLNLDDVAKGIIHLFNRMK